MGTVSILMPAREKVVAKLSEMFDMQVGKYDFELCTYKGSQDAGAYRWYTVGLIPDICSEMTMTDFIKAKDVCYFFEDNVSTHITIGEGILPKNGFTKHREIPTIRKR